MMKRTPSLRELRRKCPANVVILPTAPARQVQQQYGQAYAKAKLELIASQPVAFPDILPAVREAERRAQSSELRADVPPFDPGNPAHLRAWEAIWDMGRRHRQPDAE
jgi:hypothetical protein